MKTRVALTEDCKDRLVKWWNEKCISPLVNQHYLFEEIVWDREDKSHYEMSRHLTKSKVPERFDLFEDDFLYEDLTRNKGAN